MPEPDVARADAASKPDAAHPGGLSYTSRKPSHPIVRKTPRRFRGVPPPLPFDLDQLPDSTLLTEPEVAAALRRSQAGLQNWRRFHDHPLRWRRVGGRILYELGSVREFLKGDPNKRKPRTKK
jgi:hypothetical protein